MGKEAGDKNASQIDVAAITKSVTDSVLAAINPTIGELTKNQKIITDTLAALPPAQPAKEAAKESAAAPVDMAAVSKLVSEQIAAAMQTNRDAATKDQTRKDLIAKLVKEKLGGDDSLATILESQSDVAGIEKIADTLAAKITKPADVGGTGREGGTPPARQSVDYSKLPASEKVKIGIDQLFAKQT